MNCNHPPYQDFPILTAGDLTLRQASINDELMEISYYDGIRAASPEQAIEMQERINQDYLKGNSIHWIIVHTQTADIFGTCGYILKSCFVGKGYMTKALQQAIAFGKNTIGLKKIIAITDKGNIKSQNLLKRLGFAKERQDASYITFAYK